MLIPHVLITRTITLLQKCARENLLPFFFSFLLLFSSKQHPSLILQVFTLQHSHQERQSFLKHSCKIVNKESHFSLQNVFIVFLTFGVLLGSVWYKWLPGKEQRPAACWFHPTSLIMQLPTTTVFFLQNAWPVPETSKVVSD